MSNTSYYRRSHAKSYPVSLRCFQSPKESLVFTSPPPPCLKSKLHLTSNLSTAPETSLLSTGILTDKTNLMHTQTKPKKRVKLNCINPLATQSIMRRPLKSPKAYKLLQTTTVDRLGLTARPHPSQVVSAFRCDDVLTKIFRAPKIGKMSTIKRMPMRKTSENIGKPRNSLGNKGAISTRVTDTTMIGLSPGSNILDFTSVALGSLDDLLATDQSVVYHNPDKAEDLNRKLRSIFRGEKLDASQNDKAINTTTEKLETLLATIDNKVKKGSNRPSLKILARKY